MPSPRTATLLIAATSAVALALGGCAASTPDDSAAASGATLENAFGTTKLPADPKKIVTLGWGSTEALLALDVIPVGIEAQAYGGNDEGVLPWVEEKLDDLDAETPTIIANDGEEPDFDAIFALEPDLILAPYSGLTEDQYDTLTDIAPTVAYPDEAWSTPWRDVIQLTGDAIGRTDDATALLGDLDAELAETAAEHPEFAGKSVALTWDIGGSFWVYKGADARAEFLTDLGFTPAPAVEELAGGENDSTFAYTLSYELVDQLSSDVLVAFADTPAEIDTFLAASYAQSMPQVQSGAVAAITGTPLIASVSPPTALSFDFGLDEYVDALAKAIPAS